MEGAKKVKLFGEDIAVNAEIKVAAWISGHADEAGLKKWIASFAPKPSIVFVNHGESSVVEEYAKMLTDEFGLVTEKPYSGSEYDLATGNVLSRPSLGP